MRVERGRWDRIFRRSSVGRALRGVLGSEAAGGGGESDGGGGDSECDIAISGSGGRSIVVLVEFGERFGSDGA